MLKILKTSILMTIILTIITGIIYPLAITLISQALFPKQANGSLIIKNKVIVGSKLIGQSFTEAKYFHSRPSEQNYDALKSGGSNLGPTSKKLIFRIKSIANELQAENPNSLIPIEAVTSSASGLDPHISPEDAKFQILRVARTRNIPEKKIRKLIKKYTESKWLGVFGEERVNVLLLNLALDDLNIQ